MNIFIFDNYWIHLLKVVCAFMGKNKDDLELIQQLFSLMAASSTKILLMKDLLGPFYQNIFFQSDPNFEFMEISCPSTFDF